MTDNQGKMKIGVIVAMSSEFELVSALLEAKTERVLSGIVFLEGHIGDKSIVLAKAVSVKYVLLSGHWK